MAFDFKAATPDVTIDANAFLFGADTQAAANPSIFQLSVIKTFMSASPTLVTPTLGVAAGTSLALGGATIGSNALAVTGTVLIGAGQIRDYGSGQLGFGGTIADNLYISTNFVQATGALGFVQGPSIGSIDTFFRRGAAASWVLGSTDVSSGAVAQLLTAQGNTGSTVVGPDFTIRGPGGGSSTAVGGKLILMGGLSSAAAGTGGAIEFWTAPAAAGNAAAKVFTIAADSTVIVNSSFLQLGNTSTNYVRSLTSPNAWSFNAVVQSPLAIGLTSSISAAADVLLVRDAANTLALRNGTAAQTFNLYKTWTDASNYEAVKVGLIDTGTYGIGTYKLGTGAALDFYVNSTNRIFFDISSNRAWAISTSRTLYPANTQSTSMTDNFLNIPGAAGAPSGVPAVTTGFPLYWDSTNLKLYVYTGGAWKSSAVFT